MSGDASCRRYLSLWMPFLSSDRWRRDNRNDDGRPLVFVAKLKGVSQLVAIDSRARSLGLRSGMTLADARARLSSIRALAADLPADTRFVARLADLALAFTPSVALDPPDDGLALDITGCSHLFAGERALAARLQKVLQSAGVSTVKLAVAPTPDMARALARFSPANPCFADDNRLVRELSVAALECVPEDATALRRAGLRTIGDIADRPSLLFAARFTSAFTVKLARVLGEEDQRITPLREPVAFSAEVRSAEPVASYDVIVGMLAELAASVCDQLSARSMGGRVFEGTFLRADGAVRRIRVETSRPTRKCDVILRLYRDRLDTLADPLDPGFGFDLIRFEAVRAEPWSEIQVTFHAHDDQKDKVAQLVDRLSIMFGRGCVTRLQAVDSHIPEQAQTVLPAALVASTKAWTRHSISLRPLLLYSRAHPIDVDVDHYDIPTSFRWRRIRHGVLRWDGPERIAHEWWRTDTSGYGTRDYYRVESPEGRRFWIFRASATEVCERQRWFLHGVFP